jgi:hypothetical protein
VAVLGWKLDVILTAAVSTDHCGASDSVERLGRPEVYGACNPGPNRVAKRSELLRKLFHEVIIDDQSNVSRTAAR